jgi:hypothetical protein
MDHQAAPGRYKKSLRSTGGHCRNVRIILWLSSKQATTVVSKESIVNILNAIQKGYTVHLQYNKETLAEMTHTGSGVKPYIRQRNR